MLLNHIFTKQLYFIIDHDGKIKYGITVYCDNDAQCYIDFLSQVNQQDRPFLISHINGIINSLKEKYKNNIRVLQKNCMVRIICCSLQKN